jgi:HEAT repeat-containing protein 5
VTLDVARRIALLLSNALSFANSFISQNVEDLSDAQLLTVVKKGLTVWDHESLLRRRVH